MRQKVAGVGRAEASRGRGCAWAAAQGEAGSKHASWARGLLQRSASAIAAHLCSTSAWEEAESTSLPVVMSSQAAACPSIQQLSRPSPAVRAARHAISQLAVCPSQARGLPPASARPPARLLPAVSARAPPPPRPPRESATSPEVLSGGDHVGTTRSITP
eukprot:jgi/Mesen1/5269/ME000263S04381